MSNADRNATAVSAAEAKALFAPLIAASAAIIAVSGGPDSTALLVLAARWRHARKHGPKLIAVTVDHGLRPEAASEARAVAKLATSLGVAHRILRWTGEKPKAGLQEAARDARYRLLARAAQRAGAAHVLTAHTLDDQAETILFRLARGSGMVGLKGMARDRVLTSTVSIMRPLLDIPKARLVATVARAGLAVVDDPSNHNPRFARTRLRGIVPLLAAEGLSSERVVLLAKRLARADAAIEQMVDAAEAVSEQGGAMAQSSYPDEVALRLLGRAIARQGDGSPVELAKLEALWDALRSPEGARRRTLAGAMITADRRAITVEPAPPRRSAHATKALTTGRRSRAGSSKSR